MANTALHNQMGRTVEVPISLYESMRGRYFIGYADGLSLNAGSSAWARLYNPRLSGVNLFVDTWSVTDLSASPFRAQFWFNADPPGNATESDLVTPSNLAFRPTPVPHAELQKASAVYGEPDGGVLAFARWGIPCTTLVGEEGGKLIVPPGSSFMIYVSLTNFSSPEGSTRISFNWWEEAT